MTQMRKKRKEKSEMENVELHRQYVYIVCIYTRSLQNSSSFLPSSAPLLFLGMADVTTMYTVVQYTTHDYTYVRTYCIDCVCTYCVLDVVGKARHHHFPPPPLSVSPLLLLQTYVVGLLLYVRRAHTMLCCTIQEYCRPWKKRGGGRPDYGTTDRSLFSFPLQSDSLERERGRRLAG